MGAFKEKSTINSDKRTKKDKAVYDDKLDKFTRNFIENNPEFSYLKQPIMRWKFPKEVEIKYSTINPIHIKHMQKRRKRREEYGTFRKRENYGRSRRK